MVKNPSLHGVLRDLGDAKQLLVSGRSTKVLGTDFSASVVRLAQKRGAEMGGSAPAWLLHVEFDEVKPASLRKIIEPNRSLRWFGAGVLALAASLFLVWLAVPLTMRNEIATVPEHLSEEQDTGAPSLADVNSSVMAAQPIGSDSSHLAKTEAQNALAPIDTSIFDSSTDASLNSSGSVIVAESGSRSLESKRAESKRAGEGQGTTVAYADPAKTEAKEKLFYTMVLDVSIDPKAVENRTLERILETHNIVYTDDLVIDDSQLKNLEDSRLVGSGASSEEKMGVMFLRSTAKKLDLAICDIINQFEDFPDFALDITTDPAAKMLVKQLGSIKIAEGSDGFANRLAVRKASRNSSAFASSMRRGKPMPVATRSTYKGGMISESSQNGELSNLLFLLREAKK